jgi:hypothetical protein
MAVAEQVLDVVAGGVVQDRRQFTAHDLDVAVGDPGDQPGEVDVHRALAGPDEGDQLGAGPGLQDLRQDPHPLGDLDRRPEQVDRVPAPAAAQRRSAFDNRGAEAVALQPVRQRRSGDTGSGDQNGVVPHR